MAFRLEDFVIAGVIYHAHPLCVHGRLLLRGRETPILVELTGAPCEDLRGRSFEFEVPRNDRPPSEQDRERLARFCDQQIGPVGDMTAALRRKSFDGPVEEFFQRSEQGDPPPIHWSRCLYLEWFSQNGRVVIELLDPKLKFIDPDEPLTNSDDDPAEIADDARDQGFEVADPFFGEEFAPPSEYDPHDEPSNEAKEESYGLIPEDLDRELEHSARRVDREIAAKPDDESDPLDDMKQFDDLIENGEGTLIRDLLEHLELPAPGPALMEREAQVALNAALGQLALFSVAFHICDHCSVVDAYRILMEKLCPHCTVFPEMGGTSFVQHYSTSDFCERCRGEE
ncbi:MAG TPA: hypothetical protein VGM54_00750 [Chthoniobacter sp.]|jgi:hypothetical protein